MSDLGRPTDYNPEYADQAYKICLLGATDAQLADIFEVTESTINNWKRSYPEFADALRRGKDLADANVSHSLYNRAMGYSHPDIDIKCYEGDIITTETTKHYPPDTTAAIFWLKNRQPEKWRDKKDIDHTNGGHQFDRVPVINIMNPNNMPKIVTITKKEQFLALKQLEGSGITDDNITYVYRGSWAKEYIAELPEGNIEVE